MHPLAKLWCIWQNLRIFQKLFPLNWFLREPFILKEPLSFSCFGSWWLNAGPPTEWRHSEHVNGWECIGSDVMSVCMETGSAAALRSVYSSKFCSVSLKTTTHQEKKNSQTVFMSPSSKEILRWDNSASMWTHGLSTKVQFQLIISFLWIWSGPLL